jgi:ribosome modulation factor
MVDQDNKELKTPEEIEEEEWVKEMIELGIYDPEVEAMLEGPYQDGLGEGMKTKESYQDGLLACPYKKGSNNRELWLSGYNNGYTIRSF